MLVCSKYQVYCNTSSGVISLEDDLEVSVSFSGSLDHCEVIHDLLCFTLLFLAHQSQRLQVSL